jgi:hypothetical protein
MTAYHGLVLLVVGTVVVALVPAGNCLRSGGGVDLTSSALPLTLGRWGGSAARWSGVARYST